MVALYNQRNPKLSTREIGKLMGISPNAVIGRSHRVPECIKREDPVKRTGNVRQIKRAPKETLVMPAVSLAVATAVPVTHARTCCMPLWADHERPTHKYCGGKVATPGAPYCDAHMKVAYKKAGVGSLVVQVDVMLEWARHAGVDFRDLWATPLDVLDRVNDARRAVGERTFTVPNIAMQVQNLRRAA